MSRDPFFLRGEVPFLRAYRQTETPAEEGRKIRALFARIAPRYDLANRVLSLSVDRLWRWRVVRKLSPASGHRVLDLFCGTGDLTRALGASGAEVTGADFCPEMLLLAKERSPGLQYIAADALCLPFPDGHFDLVTAAFGVRNLVDIDRGLKEMIRVTRGGGRIGILEFSHPRAAWIRVLYRFYLRHWLPRIGGWITGDRSSYTYLSRTIPAFLDQEGLAARMRVCGLEAVRYHNFTGGIAALHVGRKH